MRRPTHAFLAVLTILALGACSSPIAPPSGDGDEEGDDEIITIGSGNSETGETDSGIITIGSGN